MSRHGSSDRGAALIHVTVVLIGLFLFSGFVVDYGTFWVSRGQAQNAADAAALAGAVARVYDDTTNPPLSKTSGKVYESAIEAAQRNAIWGQITPSSAVSLDWTCPDGSTNCVAVDLYRDGTNGSSRLPTFFLKLTGVNSQGTRAHAVAQIVGGNATNCLKPWEIPDRWIEGSSPADQQFDAGDTYRPPSDPNPTGYSTNDVGTKLTLRLADTSTPSYYQRSDLDATGDVGYRNNILKCAGGTWKIGDPLQPESGKGSVPQQSLKMDDLFAQDPNATFDGTTVQNSCAATRSCTCGACANGMFGQISPLIVYVSVVSPAVTLCSGKNCETSPILNFLPIFVSKADTDAFNDGTIVGYIVKAPGLVFASGGSLTSSVSFLQAISLVR